jgi:zinc protease
VKEANSNKVDLISTSGHATERDWNMGYNYRSGKIVPAGKGKLAGVASDGKRHKIKTSNPKIYYSPGNCLIAHIPSNLMDCMCLSWIHNGCHHFFGHVEVQTRWCTAWGITDYFFALQDTYTFAQAVHVNRIGSRYLMENYKSGREKQYWNRCLDITVLYGDPAWEAKMKRITEPVYEMKLDVADAKGGRRKITLTVKLNRKGKVGRPPIALLPFSISDWKVEKSDAKETVVADNFIMLDMTGKEYQEGDKVSTLLTCTVQE